MCTFNAECMMFRKLVIYCASTATAPTRAKIATVPPTMTMTKTARTSGKPEQQYEQRQERQQQKQKTTAVTKTTPNWRQWDDQWRWHITELLFDLIQDNELVYITFQFFFSGATSPGISTSLNSSMNSSSNSGGSSVSKRPDLKVVIPSSRNTLVSFSWLMSRVEKTRQSSLYEFSLLLRVSQTRTKIPWELVSWWARVCIKVFSTLMPSSNENKSWMRVEWLVKCESLYESLLNSQYPTNEISQELRES